MQMQKAIIGKKVGMSQIFDENGHVIPVTVIEAGPCVVVQKKTSEKEGYEAVQLGFEDISERKLTKPEKGHLDKAGVAPKKYLREFDLENAAEFLARYSPVKGIPGALINAQNYGLQGDIAVEQKDYAKAVKFYDKAVAAADNNLTAPMYLRKAGLAEQAQGNGAKAAAYYERILTSYPASMDARDAEKLLGSIK